MFNVGGGEIIVIMLLALIVLGPQRLPDAARQIGKTMGELRRLSNGFQNEVRSALDTADDPTRVAARRNVLAKEEPVDGGTAADDLTEVDDPAPKRPVRTEPLVAGPPLEARNGAAAKPATPKKPATKKPLTAKKATPKKAAAKKAATPKNGTAVTKATTDATTADAVPPAEAAPSSPPTET